MTPAKTTLTARVTPETRAALNRHAGAGHTTTSELAGRVLGEWVAAQARTPGRAGMAIDAARNSLGFAFGAYECADVQNFMQHAINTMYALLSAIDILAGTAPDDQPAA